MTEEELHSIICQNIGQNISLHKDEKSGRILIATPFEFDDGDSFVISIEQSGEKLRLTDCGHTFMHISYSVNFDINDPEIHRILAKGGVKEIGGELSIESSLDKIGRDIFRFGQTIARIIQSIENE